MVAETYTIRIVRRAVALIQVFGQAYVSHILGILDEIFDLLKFIVVHKHGFVVGVRAQYRVQGGFMSAIVKGFYEFGHTKYTNPGYILCSGRGPLAPDLLTFALDLPDGLA